MVDLLRIVAAIGVMWFHFVVGSGPFLEGSWLQATGRYGWLGVDVFFVISGFIVPYALSRGGYRVRQFPLFFLKRLIRLEPPYVASIVLVIVLNWLSTLSPAFAGQPATYSAGQLLTHLGYLNEYLGYHSLQPVYWTLAVEVQFYLLIAVSFPALSHQNQWVRLAAIAGVSALPLVDPTAKHLLAYGSVFAFGLLAFEVRTFRLSLASSVPSFVLAAVVTECVHGTAVTIASVACSALIAFVRVSLPPGGRFLSRLTYTIYLTHVPVGGRVINLGGRYAATLGPKMGVLLVAVLVTLAFAVVFYNLIERPAVRLAARLRYRRQAETVFHPSIRRWVMLAKLKHALVRIVYPTGSTRRIRRGPLLGWAIRVGPAMGLSFIWGKNAGNWQQLASLTAPGQCVYDIGANRGQSTLFLARAVGPTGHVVAFEPIPENFDDLATNVRLNGLSWVTPVCSAVGIDEGETEFLFDENKPTQGKISAAEPTYTLKDAVSVRVRLVKLDSFVVQGWPPPQLLKIDVEGGGAAVLRGAAALISAHRPTIYFEQHGPEEQAAVKEFLVTHDYQAWTLAGETVPDPTAGWFDPLICRPRGDPVEANKSGIANGGHT